MEKLGIFYLRHKTALLSGCGVLAILAITGLTWWQIMNAPPISQPFPVPTIPHPNAYDSFSQAGSQIVHEKYGAVTDERPDTPLAPLPNRIRLLRDNALALETLQQGFRYPYYQPPARGTHKAEDHARWQHSSNIRKLARLLHFAGHVAEDRGQTSEAIDHYLDAMRLGIEVPRGGGIISRLTGNSIEDIGRKRIWALTDKLDARGAASAARRLESISRERTPFVDSLIAEKWEEESALSELFQKQNTFTIAHGLLTQTFLPPPLMDVPEPTAKDYLKADIPLLFRSKRQIFADVDQHFNILIEQAQRPNYSLHWQQPTIHNDLISTRMWAGAAIIPQFDVKDRNVRMQDALLLIKLALRAYRCEHGTYPSNLASLVTGGYLAHIPDDFFSPTNEPLHFQCISSKSYRLYSVGADGTDDGGKPIRYATGKSAGKPQPKINGDEMGDFVVGANVP